MDKDFRGLMIFLSVILGYVFSIGYWASYIDNFSELSNDAAGGLGFLGVVLTIGFQMVFPYCVTEFLKEIGKD